MTAEVRGTAVRVAISDEHGHTARTQATLTRAVAPGTIGLYHDASVPGTQRFGGFRATRLEPAGALRIFLVGPGRWGTTTPSLGVPVSFPEIQRASAICEVMKLGNVIPDVSLGSHFFNDLVESNMLYLAVYPDRPGYRLHEELLRSEPNRLAELLSEDARMAGIVRVIDFPLRGDGRSLWLTADCVRQEALCYLAPTPAERPTPAD